MKMTDIKPGVLYLHQDNICVKPIKVGIPNPLQPGKSGFVYVQVMDDSGQEVGVPVITTSRRFMRSWDEYLEDKKTVDLYNELSKRLQHVSASSKGFSARCSYTKEGYRSQGLILDCSQLAEYLKIATPPVYQPNTNRYTVMAQWADKNLPIALEQLDWQTARYLGPYHLLFNADALEGLFGPQITEGLENLR